VDGSHALTESVFIEGTHRVHETVYFDEVDEPADPASVNARPSQLAAVMNARDGVGKHPRDEGPAGSVVPAKRVCAARRGREPCAKCKGSSKGINYCIHMGHAPPPGSSDHDAKKKVRGCHACGILLPVFTPWRRARGCPQVPEEEGANPVQPLGMLA